MSTNPNAFGNAPTGPAGGSLTGTYPNPVLGQVALWEPADAGLLAATQTLDAAGGSTPALTAGTVYLQKLVIRQAFTITNIVYVVSAGGSGASSGSFVGVYSSAGALLSGSADIGTNLATAAAYSTPLTTPQAVTPGFVWLALLENLATTQPVMRQGALSAFATANLGLTAATARCATDGTALTSLPASFTPAGLTLSGLTIWMGVS